MATKKTKVKAPATPVEELPITEIVEGTVIVSLLNVRERPSTTANILKTVSKNEKIKIDLTNSTENYYSVVDEGWVLKTFIKLD